MAIVVYKCDTCKRDIEILRNIYGLETVQRCTITLGCRGKLYQTTVHPDFVRASIPANVQGLDNWLQRKVLFNHEQTIENNEWRIVHQLGTFPSISVFVDVPTTEDPLNREEILPTDVVTVDEDELVLVFDRPYSGIAQLVARASDPQLLQPVNTSSVVVPAPIQVSSSGYVTFATRIDKFGDDPVINLNLKYRTNVGAEFTVSYSSVDNPAAGTPWTDANRILVKGKVYLVRQFQGVTAEIISGTIINGTNFRFFSFDFNNDLEDDYVVDSADATTSPVLPTIGTNDILLLTASAPFGTVDKITTSYIDITSVTTTKNPVAFYYDSGEFFATASVKQSIYPPIRLV